LYCVKEVKDLTNQLFVYLISFAFDVVSQLDWITYTTAGGSQTVTNTVLNKMNFLLDAFYVENDQSVLVVQGLTIEQNQAIGSPWNAIVVRNGAVANISQTLISDNVLLRFGIISFNAATAVTDSIIRQNRGVVSALRKSNIYVYLYCIQK
jgi:hypothetical protein